MRDQPGATRALVPPPPDHDHGFEPAFAGLDPGLPLLLLPVRLETRFSLDGEPPVLLLRVHPDDISTDGHVPGLEPGEVEAGRRFWSQAWMVGSTREDQLRGFGRLATRVGPYRAAWVLEATRPLNWGQRAAALGIPPIVPLFPPAPARDTVTPSRARLLPERWVAIGYQENEYRFTVAGGPIDRDLAVAPDLAATGAAPGTIGDLIEDQGLGWLRSFEAAESVGMAMRIPLRPWERQKGLELLVLGACSAYPSATIPATLADLLASHHWTHGLDFVRRGTPTNNTDLATSGVSLSEPDLGALLDTVLAVPRPASPLVLPLSSSDFGTATRHALGLADGTIVDRLPGRDDEQLILASAMNAALWPATWGHLLRSLLSGAVAEDWIDWTRRRFVGYVAGGGALPALRVGRLPYGVLPVRLDEISDPSPDPSQTLQNLLLGLVPTWDDAVTHRVAHLDPDATDLAGEFPRQRPTLGRATATLARVLAATPNPSVLAARPVTDQTGLYQWRWGIDVVLLDWAVSPTFPDIATELGTDLGGAATLEEQIAVLEDVIEAGHGTGDGALWSEANNTDNDQATRDAAQAAIDFVADSMLPLLYGHRDRIEPFLDLAPDRAAVTGKMADGSDPPIFFSWYGEDGEQDTWTGPLVADDPAAAADVAVWLDALAVEAADPDRPAAAPGEHAPLLFQLLKRSIAVVAAADRDALVDGLRTLADAAADGRLADPVGDLETLLGETLGTCMHRLDAWLSGNATNRLEAVRRTRPAGLEAGAYGWVVDLRPAPAGTPSQGFVHAPSLDHAATAAILRSGWSALGGGLGVDVSSARVRAAEWIVDGLRDGLALAELLGQSLERRLHDAFLDRHVEPLRRAVLDATGRPDAPAAGIVDGLLVARGWLGADQVAPLTAAETAVAAGVDGLVAGAGADAAGLRTVLDAHAADLDAVADTGLVQAVHAVVRGSPEQASATMTGAGSGDAGPPALTSLRTARGGQRVSHRLLLVLDAAAGPAAAGDSPSAIAEPALEAWLASLMPLDAVVYGAWVVEDGARSWQGPFTLAGSGIGWLDLLGDLPAGASLGPGPLARRLEWTIARAAAAGGRAVDVRIDPAAGGRAGPGQLPLRLFLAAAQSLRGLLHGGRAADAADLGTGRPASTTDVAAVAARESRLSTTARAAADRLRHALGAGADGPASAAGQPSAADPAGADSPTSEVLDAMVALAGWRVPGAVPGAGLRDLATAGGDTADRDALLTAGRDVLARMDARLAARDAVEGDDLTAVLARIRALLPGTVVLPPFTPPDLPGLRASAGRSAARLGGPAAAVRWLHQVGRARDRTGAAAAAVDLVDAAAGRTRFDPVLVQLPDHPGEGWAATTAPVTDRSPRTCLLCPAWPDPAADRFAGLVLDAWTEVIPDRRATTGLAVHFDAPSARAPQACLLAVPPTSGGWSSDHVLAVLRQTLKRARQRAVGPAAIDGWGQFLPAVFLGADADPGPAPEA